MVCMCSDGGLGGQRMITIRGVRSCWSISPTGLTRSVFLPEHTHWWLRAFAVAEIYLEPTGGTRHSGKLRINVFPHL